MTGRSAFRLGQGIGGLIAVAIVICVSAWGDFLRLTADVDGEQPDEAAWSAAGLVARQAARVVRGGSGAGIAELWRRAAGAARQ